MTCHQGNALLIFASVLQFCLLLTINPET